MVWFSAAHASRGEFFSGAGEQRQRWNPGCEAASSERLAHSEESYPQCPVRNQGYQEGPMRTGVPLLWCSTDQEPPQERLLGGWRRSGLRFLVLLLVGDNKESETRTGTRSEWPQSSVLEIPPVGRRWVLLLRRVPAVPSAVVPPAFQATELRVGTPLAGNDLQVLSRRSRCRVLKDTRVWFSPPTLFPHLPVMMPTPWSPHHQGGEGRGRRSRGFVSPAGGSARRRSHRVESVPSEVLGIDRLLARGINKSSSLSSFPRSPPPSPAPPLPLLLLLK